MNKAYWEGVIKNYSLEEALKIATEMAEDVDLDLVLAEDVDGAHRDIKVRTFHLISSSSDSFEEIGGMGMVFVS